MKLAFIGYGRHAKLNLYPSLKHLGYELSAVATAHQESADIAKKELITPNTYADYREMVKNEKPDAVFVSVKEDQYMPIVTDLLDKNIHVFTEKPVAITLSDAKQLAETAKNSKAQLMVGYMKRFAPAFIKAKEFMLSPDFGTPLTMDIFMTSRNFAKNLNEYLLYAAIHYIDLMRYFYGDVENISGREVAVDGSLMQVFAIQFKNGAVASVHLGGSPAWGGGRQEITLTGTNGYVKVTAAKEVATFTANAVKDLNTPRWQGLFEEERVSKDMVTTSGGNLAELYLNGFVGELKHFVESIEASTPVINTAQDNVKLMEIVEMMNKSVEK